ncbi:MAG: CpaF family protein [Sphingomonadales bacterium]|jgi:pilus assembly protein CpaF
MFGKKAVSPISKSLAGAQAVRYRQPYARPAKTGSDIPSFLQKPPQGAKPQDLQSDDAQIIAMKETILPRVLDRIDTKAAAGLNNTELREELRPVIMEVLSELKFTLNKQELIRVETLLVDELLGLGPLEDLLANPEVSDIMVNGHDQVYVECRGKLKLTNIRFRDDDHVRHIAQRICNRVGRRIDQTTPVADARLEDGSRVNVIMPPLSIHGTSISIRKFAVMPFTLEKLAESGCMSRDMASFLAIAAAARLNIIISGGTGSGKTTLLNALSRMIDPGERVVTIEDAAELQLQQPHVVSLESRPPNLEGDGAYTIGDLLRNALRMRPDRIILGEVRGPECIDMLQAMNTGHEGSMCTLHANQPREALTRMENMVSMAGLNYPLRAIRQQIVDAIDIVVQVRRLRDGSRKITSITEIVGLEEDIITTQTLFSFDYDDQGNDGTILGQFSKNSMQPYCIEKIRIQGFERALMEAMK